jgi:DnaK suppressor protein
VKAQPAKTAASQKKTKASPSEPVSRSASAGKPTPAEKTVASKSAKAVKPAPAAAMPAVQAVSHPVAKPVPAAPPSVVKTPIISAPPALRQPASSRSSSRGRAAEPAAMAAPVLVPATYSRAASAPAISFVPIPKDPKLANNWKNKSPETLTDAEVLAMPDSEYMNDKQQAFFRLKLVQLKQDILANAGETTEHLREDTVIVPDPADRATIEEEHALELRTRDRERKLLKKIEQSIARIDAGDYGYCDETGEPIGVGRLLARPTATLSLEAQQRRELKQKMFGD